MNKFTFEVLWPRFTCEKNVMNPENKPPEIANSTQYTGIQVLFCPPDDPKIVKNSTLLSLKHDNLCDLYWEVGLYIKSAVTT